MEEENKKIEIDVSTVAMDEKEKLQVLDAKKIIIEKKKNKSREEKDEDIIQ